MWVGYGNAASTDMLFSMALGQAILFAFHWIEGGGRSIYLAYFFLALSLLAKGPAGPLLFALIAGSYALYRRRFVEKTLNWAHARAVALFAAIGLPWYVYMIATHGRVFVDDFLLNHNIRRFATGMFQHPKPPYYFPLVLIVGTLPFAALLIARRLPRDPLSVLSLFAVAWPVVFFTLSQSKLPGYVLPCFPFLALILAAMPDRGRTVRLTMGTVQLAAAAYIAWSLAGLDIPPTRLILLLAPFVAAAILFMVRRVSIVPGALLMMLGYLVLKTAGGPCLDEAFSVRPVARAVLSECTEDELVLLREDRRMAYGLSYYAGVSVPASGDPHAAMSMGRPFILTTPAGVDALRSEAGARLRIVWANDEHILVRATRPTR